VCKDMHKKLSIWFEEFSYFLQQEGVVLHVFKPVQCAKHIESVNIYENCSFTQDVWLVS
jgi:hypothetical protein